MGFNEAFGGLRDIGRRVSLARDFGAALEQYTRGIH
jgi:hypothetical protein